MREISRGKKKSPTDDRRLLARTLKVPDPRGYNLLDFSRPVKQLITTKELNVVDKVY